MSAEEYFDLYKKCVDIESIQFNSKDFKRFKQSKNIKIVQGTNCIAIIGLAKSEIEIYFIGVAERFKRRGLGKKLLENIISFSKDYGSNVILLEVGVNNIAAKNLYLSFNFKECGIRKGYYRNRQVFDKMQ